MRNRIAICLAATAAACSGTANNNAADGNGANAAAANTAAPEPAGNNAAETESAEADTAAAESAEANAAWANATAGNEVQEAVRDRPPPANASYNASGTEPFWTLTIANGMMNYQYPGGGAGGMAPEPTPVPNGFEFRTPQLTARFTERPCTEASGQTIRYTVRVTAQGRTVNGCGR